MCYFFLSLIEAFSRSTFSLYANISLEFSTLFFLFYISLSR
nr:MAG TPA: hypothetical protein [Caudoviricetes sp.]